MEEPSSETLERKIGNRYSGYGAKKRLSRLESTVSELASAAKSAFNLGVSAAAPTAGYALTGNPNIIATSASFVAGSKGRKNTTLVKQESLSGAIFGIFSHYFLSPLGYLTSVGKAAYMTLFPFAANAFYMAEDHLIKNKSLKGLHSKFRENYFANVKKSFKTVHLINLSAALFLPLQYMVGAVAVAAFIYRKFVVSRSTYSTGYTNHKYAPKYSPQPAY